LRPACAQLVGGDLACIAEYFEEIAGYVVCNKNFVLVWCGSHGQRFLLAVGFRLPDNPRPLQWRVNRGYRYRDIKGKALGKALG
jgi:hypothetical protein